MKRAILLLALAFPMFGALTTATVFEVEQGGNNANAGCFIEGAAGTDRSQQTSPQLTLTDLVIDGSNAAKVTSASHNFVTADEGNCLRVSAGTGFTTGLYYIVSTASNAATLDRNVGTTSSTGGSAKMGGALATLAQLNTDMCSSCRAWVKADADYVISSKVTFNFSNSGASWIRGYTSSRGDNGRATIKSTGSIGGDRLVDINVAQNFTFANFTFNVNSDTGVSGIWVLNQPTYLENIEVKNFNAIDQIRLNNVRGICRYCYIHDGTSTSEIFYFVNSSSACIYCSIVNVAGNGAIGFLLTDSALCLHCAVVNLTGTTTDAFHLGNQEPMWLDHVLCYNVSRDCVQIITTGLPIFITNSIFATAVSAIDNTSGTTLRANDFLNDYNFIYNLSGTAYNGVTAGSHSVTLTKSPFVNAGSLDFRLNNTKGGGSSVRAHGAPSSMPGFLGTYYPDAGVAQHQDPKFIF